MAQLPCQDLQRVLVSLAVSVSHRVEINGGHALHAVRN